MVNVLTRKLELFQSLSKSDEALLDDVTKRSRTVSACKDIVCEGETSKSVVVVLDGFACRYKQQPDGSRHIFACLVPGDLSDIDAHLLPSMDHTIATLSACTIAEISRERLVELMCSPQIARALRWATLVDVALLREWLANFGLRSAESRIGHFFCELHLRLDCIGLVAGGESPFPFTQTELADAMGLSAVHVNRVLQSLRARGLIGLQKGRLLIPDLPRLQELSGFNPRYLFLRAATRMTSDARRRSPIASRMHAQHHLS